MSTAPAGAPYHTSRLSNLTARPRTRFCSVIKGDRKARSRPAAPSAECTPKITPQAAALAHRVFGVAELLDLVLSNLDMLDLLRSRQVSRMFRDVIEASHRIQETLFLRPIEGALLGLRRPPVIPSGFSINLIGHPMLWLTCTLLPLPTATQTSNTVIQPISTPPSWQSMLLTQPPTTELQYSIYEAGWGKVKTLRRDEGITFGDVATAARDLRAEIPHVREPGVAGNWWHGEDGEGGGIAFWKV